jgi:hypothetical protein
MTTSIIGTLTTGERIVAAGSAFVLLAMTAPIVWLFWLFVQMHDAAVSRAIDDAQRLAERNERARRARGSRMSHPRAGAFGLGAVFVGATTAANAGIDEDQTGLAAGLLNTGQQLGGALGLAVLSATATAHTTSLLEAGEDTLAAATGGYQWALVAGAGFALGAAVIALFSSNTHQAAPVTEEEPALDLAA